MKFAVSKIDMFIQSAEYLAACIICLIFALYCSGRVGYFLLIVLALAPAISWIYTFALSRILKVSFNASSDLVSKGTDLKTQLEIAKPFILPVPAISVKIRSQGGLICTDEERHILAGPGKKYTETVVVDALHASGAYIGIGSAEIYDFFSVVKFDIKQKDSNMYLIGILPEANDSVEVEKELQTVLEEASDIREYEESSFEKSGGFGGFPGYEHRKYEPGDPIKRINYKLSAKHDELFVRLDEQQINGKVVITLERELPLYIEQDKYTVFWEQLVERKLGLLMLLLARQFVVEFRYTDNKCKVIADGSTSPFEKAEESIRSIEIKDINEVPALAQKLAYCIYLIRK